MPKEHHIPVLLTVPPEYLGTLFNLLTELQSQVGFTIQVGSAPAERPAAQATEQNAAPRPPARRDAVHATLKAGQGQVPPVSTPSRPERAAPTPKQTLRHQAPQQPVHVKLLTHSYRGQTFLLAQMGEGLYHRHAEPGDSPEVQAVLFAMHLTETSPRPVMVLIGDGYVCKSFDQSLRRWADQGWVNGTGQAIRNAATWEEIYLRQTRLKATHQSFMVRQVDDDARNRTINKRMIERFEAQLSEER